MSIVNKPRTGFDSGVDPNRPRSLREYVGLVARGFCMGASDVVPGVSGGTMAFILGIYEDLVLSIKTIDLTVIRLALQFKIKEIFEVVPWKFLLAVLSGIVAAVLTLAPGLEWLLENHPVLIWSFFFGLILASVFVVGRRIPKWEPKFIVALVVATVGAFWLVGLVPAETPDAPWFIFLSGAIVICAMILPGISGSFILVLLGKYQYILSAVNNRDVVTIGIFVMGAAIGITTFAQVLSWLFKRYHDLTMAVLTGFMIGSLRAVWPWKEVISTRINSQGHEVPLLQVPTMPATFDGEVLFAFGLALLGMVVVISLERLANQQGHQAEALS